MVIVPIPISRSGLGLRHDAADARFHTWKVIADENDERALWPAHIGSV
jgi:hypothetical protein